MSQLLPVISLLAALSSMVACGPTGGSPDARRAPATAVESRVEQGAERGASPEPRVLIGLDGDTLAELRLGDEEWERRLSPEQYFILREDGTERPFTSELLEVKAPGTFVCAACALPLFATETKFDSRTGWPSFYEPIRADHIAELRDTKLGMVRTEVRCARCDGHQGHVFEDGPRPTGLRYCINGDALSFVAAGETP